MYNNGGPMSNYLVHAKKGSKRAKHKYITREWNNGSWVYKYQKDDSPKSYAQDVKDYTKSNGFKNEKDYQNFKQNRDKDDVILETKGFYDYNPKTGKMSMTKDAEKRLKEMKQELDKSKREIEKFERKRKLGRFNVNKKKSWTNEEYYSNSAGDRIDDPMKFGKNVQAEERALRERNAYLNSQYKRNLKLAEKEKQLLKQYRRDQRVQKGKEIINNIFGKLKRR